jgi:hypothetical protein
MRAPQPAETELLIDRLVAEAGARPARPMALWLAVGAGLPALLVLALLLGAFHHHGHFGPTTGFTLAAAGALAVLAFAASLSLARPDAVLRARWIWLPAAAILAAGAGFELVRVPRQEWLVRLVGIDPLTCFLSVFVLSLPILAGALWALRHGAPGRPRLSGALAGLLAGGVTAALYLVHCPEDSLLFTIVWHVPAVALVTALGALLGHRWLRW